MTDTEVVFTYETLYELLRREKGKEELQELDERFYKEALTYLKEKQELYDETLKKDDLFSANERDALYTQINNIRKLLKDLYDKRERKIIDMAVNAVKINKNIIDTSALQDTEKEIYDKLTTVLEHFRKNILLNVLMLRQPATEEKETETKEEKIKIKEKKEQEQKIKTVKFKEKVEQFVGKNLELYGPFSAEDEARLPTEIAQILLNQGKAEEI